MKRTALIRQTPLRRRRPKALSSDEKRAIMEEALYIYRRDNGCVAARYDPAHHCEGRLTLAHVPEEGKNALGKKPEFDRWHLVVECLLANSGGTQPWSETHRDVERAHLAKMYPDRYAS